MTTCQSRNQSPNQCSSQPCGYYLHTVGFVRAVELSMRFGPSTVSPILEIRGMAGSNRGRSAGPDATDAADNPCAEGLGNSLSLDGDASIHNLTLHQSDKAAISSRACRLARVVTGNYIIPLRRGCSLPAWPFSRIRRREPPGPSSGRPIELPGSLRSHTHGYVADRSHYANKCRVWLRSTR